MLRRAGLYGVFLCPFTGKPIRRGIPDLRFDSKNSIKTEEKQMGFNYAWEKRKFDEKWKKLDVWYRESGMSEDAIREMYKYDWSEFNSTRKFYRYGDDDIDVESIVEEDGDSIDKTFSEEWIELLETPNLVRKVRKLPADYIEIIDLMVRENLTQEEVAGRMRCSQQNIAKKIEKIRKLLS